ncbi:alpha/beta hydrolase, partial [Streptomyces sp. NPDC055886]
VPAGPCRPAGTAPVSPAQLPGPGCSASRTSRAIRTRLSTSSLLNRLLVWALTVATVMPSRSAISRLPSPSAMARAVSSSRRARMVSADQGGHGVYPFGTNTCAGGATTTFLTTGKRPSGDLRRAAQ